MLRRQAVATAGALVAVFAMSAAPAAADDDAGAENGSIWGSAEEFTGGDDTGGDGGDDGDGSTDSTDSSTPSGGGSDDGCAADDSLTLHLAGYGGNCGFVPYPDEGDPAVAQVVDAEEEAQRAFERLPLQTANVRIAPEPPLPTYPNLETWIWVPESQWQPLTLDVSVGSTTVYVEARPVRIEIDSGERDQMKYSSTTIDSTLTCSGPGQAWDESLGDDAETSCGYTYQTTSSNNPAGGDRYELTAAIVYAASWTCVGQCSSDGGSLGETTGPTGSLLVDVQERQSVVVD